MEEFRLVSTTSEQISGENEDILVVLVSLSMILSVMGFLVLMRSSRNEIFSISM